MAQANVHVERRRLVLVASLRALGSGTLLALLAAGTVTVASGTPSLPTFGIGLAIGMSQAIVVGVVPSVLFTSLEGPLRRASPLRRWSFIVAALVVLALAGSAAAALILVAAGNTDVRELAKRSLPMAAITFVIALLFGLSALSFDRLGERLRRTTDALRDTEMERIRAQRLAFEARLASLESRVRPHFLFNSLNAALALIPEDASAAERVLERLASLLHASLDANPRQLVPLGREMALVTDYLEIERVRFGDRLRLTLDVPADLEPALVPSFSVQTLVENCVKHAIAPNPDGGTMRVEARRDGRRLVVLVTDDGPGFTAEAIVPGHGLDTLRARLAALYERSELTVAPIEGGGSQVTLSVALTLAATLPLSAEAT